MSALRSQGVTGLLAIAALTMLVGCTAGVPSAATSDVVAAQPWVAGERYTYALTDGNGNTLGEGVLSTAKDAGRLVLEQRYAEGKPPAGATPTSDVITVTVDATTFRPLEGHRETVRRDEGGKTTAEKDTWRYTDVQGTPHLVSRIERQGAAVVEGDVALRAHWYDNESSLWLWRGLAFAEGYEKYYVSANPFERSQQTVNLRIPRREPMTVPAGTFQTWRVILRNGRAVRTAWVNADAPHQVVRWDNGDVIFELTKAETPR